jgi:hypothetical protein
LQTKLQIQLLYYFRYVKCIKIIKELTKSFIFKYQIIMIYDKEGDMNFDGWVSYNRDVFPEELTDYFEVHKDILHVMFYVRPKIKRYLTPALRKLMYRQYPVLRAESRPLIVEFIDDIIYIIATEIFIMKMYHLVNGHNTGVNVRDLYPELDSWVDFYCRPAKPYTMDVTHRKDYWWKTDAEWEAQVEYENSQLLEIFNWEQSRQSEFINLVQNAFFKYYPELLDLSSDEWIVFAVEIREEYESFKTYCDHIEEFIDCQFPEEDMKLTDNEYFEKYRTLPEVISKNASEIRDRRISGEKI